MHYKRVVIARTGGPEVLQVVEEELPEPQPGAVRVKVLTTGVAFADVMMRCGMYPGPPPLPFSPGYDIVGVVDALGAGVSSFEVGQRVAALTVTGGYAEFLCLPADSLVPVPAGLDPAEAVSLVLNYVTAYQMLHRIAKVKRGERILIHGAAGGVGTALLQLGKLAGVEMYGTTSQSKHPLVYSLGGIPINYKREDFVKRIKELTGEGVDAVFDPIGGSNFWRSHRSLRAGGRLVAYGLWKGLKNGRRDIRTIMASAALVGVLKGIPNRQTLLYAINQLPKPQPDWLRQDLTVLFNLLIQKQIHPVIAERLPLTEVARAHELLSKSAVRGKIVLLCDREQAFQTQC